jgi:predicted alpha/beta-fold hydrolase
MKSLKPKFIHKSKQFPGKIDISKFDKMKTWRQFDDTFTAQVTGFANADEYYRQGSAKYFIDGIRINTLIINAVNDPFLQEPSYPVASCEKHRFVYLEMPRYGGHVGFWFPSYDESYAESRVMQFIEQFS